MSTSNARQSRDVAESAREKQWKGESFLKDLYNGRFRLDLVRPHPAAPNDRPAFRRFYAELERFLRSEVDPVTIDATGEYPQHVLDGLRELGAFGMKIAEEYGGLGLSHAEYVEAMKLLGSHDANVTALLSAHQAIGVPQPVKLFGSEALKREYLPRCAKGAISAFALTEPAVGSDPARLQTRARRSEDGEHWILDGEKLWCTNGTLAEVIVVMARDPETERINAFVVDTSWEGVTVEHRCRFMGLRALANAVLTFDGVKIPKGNLLGDEGDGLKIALVTLNTGRLSLPATASGLAKLSLEIARKWCSARVQWGEPIGHHEAIAHKLADLAATAFAMEAIADLLGAIADDPAMDIRLEAAAAKEWNTSRGWELLDELIQIRGGRGYETERSLRARGEPPVPAERLLRDARINRIFEGSSEIMHLFVAREAVDEHLQVAGTLADPDATTADVLKALPGIAWHYLKWYPSRWIGWSWWPRFREFGELGKHLRFVERASRKLARQTFHGMARWQGGLEKKQAFLFRVVDIGLECYAITAAVTRAHAMREQEHPRAESAVDLADLFSRRAERRIKALFKALWRNDDVRTYKAARRILDGDLEWLEQGTIGLPYDVDDVAPPTMKELLEERHRDDAVATDDDDADRGAGDQDAGRATG